MNVGRSAQGVRDSKFQQHALLQQQQFQRCHLRSRDFFFITDSQEYDLIVIGGGSGGLACSKEGEKT